MTAPAPLAERIGEVLKSADAGCIALHVDPYYMADLLRESLAELERRDKKIRALRNRLVSELQTNVDGSYEYRRAVAESRVNEFETAFDEAINERQD